MNKAKVTYSPHSTLSIEFEVTGQKDFMESMAGFQEILNNSCQKCKYKPLFEGHKPTAGYTFVVREVDGNKFYELKCKNCGATLSFGAHKKGDTLFPQRKDTEGENLPNYGWTKWNPDTKQKE